MSTVNNPTPNNDNITISRAFAERGLWLAIIAAILGYFNIDVIDREAPHDNGAIVVDVDKDFVKTAAQAINDLHNENVAIRARINALETRVGLPPISPIKPGNTGAIESKGSNKAVAPIGDAAPNGTKPKS